MRVLAFPRSSAWNPYTSLLYDAVEKLGVEVVAFDSFCRHENQADILHVHWPEWFLGRRNPIAVWRDYSRWMKQLRDLKRQGTKVVWTVHNLRSHERRHERLQDKFWREFAPLVDGCVFLSESSRELVKRQFSALACPSAVVPHGHYRDVYPNTVRREEARMRLGIGMGTFVYVHVGMVRAYKNVPELIEAFRGVDGGAALMVAGEVFESSLKRRVLDAASNDVRVRVDLRRVEDGELQTYFKAADIAVFPYRDILNSGSALMALSFDTPVLVPAIGSMPELREQIGFDWVQTYEGPISASMLEEAHEWATTRHRAEHAPLDSLNWAGLAERTVEFYRSVTRGAG